MAGRKTPASISSSEVPIRSPLDILRFQAWQLLGMPWRISCWAIPLQRRSVEATLSTITTETWVVRYFQDNWKVSPNLTLNLGAAVGVLWPMA